MSPTITALGEPWAWRMPRTGLGQFLPWTGRAPIRVLHHSSGCVVLVETAEADWVVRDPLDTTSGIPLARFPRTGPGLRLKDFRRALDAAYGPDARARFDRVMLRVRLDCLQKGLRGNFTLMRDPKYHAAGISIAGNVTPEEAHKTLSQAVRKEVFACRGVLHAYDDGAHLSPYTLIPFEVPTSAHAVMTFLESVRQAGLSIEPAAHPA